MKISQLIIYLKAAKDNKNGNITTPHKNLGQ